VSKENTIKQLKDKLSKCPICGSGDGYSVSPSNYVFQCNACGAKFVSNDLKKVDSEFKEMGLFSPPTEMDNHANREALESIKFKHYPIDFWKNMDTENIKTYIEKKNEKKKEKIEFEESSLDSLNRYLSKCPICGSDKGYEQFGGLFSGPFGFRCVSCNSEWKPPSVYMRFKGDPPPSLTLRKVGDGFKGSSLIGISLSIQLWKSLDVANLGLNEEKDGKIRIGEDIYFTEHGGLKTIDQLISSVEQETGEKLEINGKTFYFKLICPLCKGERHILYSRISSIENKIKTLSVGVQARSLFGIMDSLSGDFTTSAIRRQTSYKSLTEMDNLRNVLKCPNCGSLKQKRILFYGDRPAKEKLQKEQENSALEILKIRLAKGEITKEEYKELKEIIET